jgi:hypothetical protein
MQSSIYQGIVQKTYKIQSMGRSPSAQDNKRHLRDSLSSVQPTMGRAVCKQQ